MSAAREVTFGGTDEELEKHLAEFAARTGARAARDRRPGVPPRAWELSSGSLLSPNPNTIPLKLRVQREGNLLRLESAALALPWTRAKIARILAFRRGQLADYLTQRARGSGPEAFDGLRLREPFATYGSDPAAISASYTWAAASGVAALLGTALACVLVFAPLLSLATREIGERASLVEAARGLPLPSRAELDARGVASTLAAAFVFGFPVAFLGGFVHALALAAADLHARASRLPQSSFLFLAILVGVGLFPFMPFLCWPLALVLPSAAHLAHSIVWGRRRERVREGARPRPALVAVGMVLAAGLAAAVMPRPAAQAEFLDRVALFRDRVLLGHPLGRLAAEAYYRHTLYAADPLKEFFSVDERRAVRSHRIAVCPAPEPAAVLRALDFSVLPSAASFDVAVGDRGLFKDGTALPLPPAADLAAWRRALSELSGRTFRGGPLRDVSWLGWQALVLGGPVAALLAFCAISTPFVSLMFRILDPRAALAALVLCGFVTTVGYLWGESRIAGEAAALQGLRETPDAARLGAALAHASPAVRHEAAYRACRIKDAAPLADALLKAADDPDLRVRLWAVAALGRTGDPRALDRLVERLSDRELFVRYRAAEGLGFLKDPRAEAPLERMARGGSWYEGLYALQALRRIRPERW